MNDNKEYTIELSVEDERFTSVYWNWFGYGELLKDMIEHRSQRYPECTQRFVLLNEIRALFGGVIDEEGWFIGKVWDRHEPTDIWDIISVDNDNPIGVVIYVQDMTKLDKSYREMSFYKCAKEDK